MRIFTHSKMPGDVTRARVAPVILKNLLRVKILKSQQTRKCTM